MKTNGEPSWISELNDEELEFIKFFVLSSGSIKKLSNICLLYTSDAADEL